ncbi:MAG TPA: TonB-dependent receptor, partial [Caulobacter sp.]|nr:TonB-dependent receptor [Caulobacter sp.]
VQAAPRPLQGDLKTYDLKPQPLAQALSEVARVSGRQVVVSSSLVRGKTAPALNGRYTPDQAYEVLLSGSGLKLTPVGAALVVQTAGGRDAGVGEPPAGDAEILSELIVTGTRIRGAAPVGSNLISITRRDIEASGYATTQQIVQSLPQNYGGGPNETLTSIRNNASANIGYGSSVNLRGLGTSSTLVLINGSRPALGGVSGAFADLSLIPSSALERVEVLADGASALYGSDAVAGVVNVILRGRFEGAETRVRRGWGDGFDETQVSQLVGRRWSRGRLVLGYEYNQRGRLAAADRDFATADLRPFGARDYRSTFAAPGTLVAGGKTYALGGATLIPGTTNLEDPWAQADLAPRQRRHALIATGAFDITDQLVLDGQVLFADRRFNIRQPANLRSATSVPVANPFYVDPLGTHLPVSVRYSFVQDLGPQTADGRARAYNGALGLTQHIGAWSAGFGVVAGQQRETSRTGNLVNTARLALALADTNPTTAYNLFAGPGANRPETVAKIRGSSTSHGLSQVKGVSLKADGPLFDLPAGAVRLAFGGEARREQYKQTTVSDLRTLSPTISSAAFPKPREISAAYAELLVPVTAAGSTLGALDVSLAGRYEHYSDFGDTTNPKVGLSWKPTSTLTVRGAYGRSFRAPSFQDQIQTAGTVLYTPLVMTDPASPTGTSKVLALLGNSVDIGPERATTYTAGVDWRPTRAPGLKVSASYYKVRYRDRIVDPNADLFNILLNRSAYASLIDDNPPAAKVQALYGNVFFSNTSGIAAADIDLVLDARVQNLAVVVQDGVDLDASYATALAGGDLRMGITASYILRLEQAVSAKAGTVDILGTVGNPARWRTRASLGWSRGAVDLNAFLNVVDGYRNQTVAPNEPIGRWTTTDLQLSYRLPGTGLLRDLRATLSINNLFDRDPPFANLQTPQSAIGYDSDGASAFGRLVAVQLTKSW